MLFQNMSLSLKEGQFLLVCAAGRTERGGYTMGEILSLSVDEVDQQISLFAVFNHRGFNLRCHATDVLK